MKVAAKMVRPLKNEPYAQSRGLNYIGGNYEVHAFENRIAG
jgi:hypothetical protein